MVCFFAVASRESRRGSSSITGREFTTGFSRLETIIMRSKSTHPMIAGRSKLIIHVALF